MIKQETSPTTSPRHRGRRPVHPWAWIPSLYFAEGLPYVVVMSIAVVMYKRLGLGNAEIALFTSWLYLPWVIKPLWSPIVDVLRTKRWWILAMQILIGASLAGVAFSLRAPHGIQWSLAFFWLMAFSSATHDIAADGFYMLALDEHDQALNVGIRSTFYRIATIAGQGLLTMFAGVMEVYTRIPFKAWAITMGLTALLLLAIAAYHTLILPRPEDEKRQNLRPQMLFGGLLTTFTSFFKKPQILVALAFLLLYRFPEALLTKICPLFFLDKADAGGLGLTTAEVGIVQGTVGVIGLTLGGIFGGVAVAADGFRKWLLPMVLAISLPNAVYIFLAYYQPTSLAVINVAVFIEQFGYGFGFTAYMLYMIYFSRGASKTAHYAFCTGLMALGMMLPGMAAGWLQEATGYLNFFIIVMCLTPVTFLVASLIRVEPGFGKKENV